MCKSILMHMHEESYARVLPLTPSIQGNTNPLLLTLLKKQFIAKSLQLAGFKYSSFSFALDTVLLLGF